MATKADLDNAETALGTEITALIAVISTAETKIASLISKMGAPGFDPATEVAGLQSMLSSLQNAHTTLQTAVDSATSAGA